MFCGWGGGGAGKLYFISPHVPLTLPAFDESIALSVVGHLWTYKKELRNPKMGGGSSGLLVVIVVAGE